MKFWFLQYPFLLLSYNFGERGFAFVDEKFREEAAKHHGAVEMFEEFKDAMEGLVRAVETFSIGKEGALEKRGINLDEFTRALAAQLEEVVNTIVAEFSEPAPKDQDEWYKNLDMRVSKILDQVEDAIVAAFATFGLQVPEFEVRAGFGHLKPHIKRVILIAGALRAGLRGILCIQLLPIFADRFARRHPTLVSMVVITATFLVAEAFVPPLFLEVLSLLGFRRLGPVKGEGGIPSIIFWF